MVPGLGLDARTWRRVWPLLPATSTVVPLPSLGRRAPRGTDLGAVALADRLDELLPRGRPLVLVGHSASCQVVVVAAQRRPEVRGLVLLGPTTDPAAATWPRMLTRWARTVVHERAWEVVPLAPQYRRTGPMAMARGMDRLRSDRTDLALTGLERPVVVLRGEHDDIAPASWCADLAQRCGGVVTTVAGGAHMLPLTHPREVAATIEGVLASPGTTSPRGPARIASTVDDEAPGVHPTTHRSSPSPEGTP